MNTPFVFDTNTTDQLTNLISNIKTIADLQQCQQQYLPTVIKTILDFAALPKPLNDACHYAINNGGKRVRPLLVLAAFLTVVNSHKNAQAKHDQQTLQMVCRAMAAVELIHGYSLVHDDLPCMDDDDLRRGQPTCHIAYGEDVALLVGDALQAMAFEALTTAYHSQNPNTLTAFWLTQTLALRARRMVSGQLLDIQGENQALCQAKLQAIHYDKTGALIEAAVLMGGICADSDKYTLDRLTSYAQAVGLAFQVQDDVLDAISDTQTLGKPAGSDEKLQKSTYVKLLGVQQADDYANQLFEQARQSVAVFGHNNLLTQLVNWLQHRKF